MLELPALDGRVPLGFLAALGVLQLVTEHTDHPARLAWSRATGTAELHDAHDSVDDLVDDLAGVVAAIPADGVLPNLAATFPPLGAAPDRLRLRRTDFRAYAASAADIDGEAVERWIASLVTDLSVDKEGRASISLFTAPSGKQSMRTMLEKPLELVRARPEVLREALVAWRRYSGVSGEYLDHRALQGAADSVHGAADNRGVPGATWLALMSYPSMLTTSTGAKPTTTGWQSSRGRGGAHVTYPLWSAPLDVHAVQALLTHPVLDGAPPGPADTSFESLTVFWISSATRRASDGSKSAGFLAPLPPARIGPAR